MNAKQFNNWETEALCYKSSPTIFFPPVDFEPSKQRRKRETKAKTICNVCPVCDDCLEYALQFDQLEGVWGGLNFKERQQKKLNLELSKNK